MTDTATGMMQMDRAALSRQRFEQELRAFVEAWAPKEPYLRDEFQRHMMILMRGAMQSQCDTMAMGIEHYASDQFRALALHPLHAIFENPKPGKDRP